MTGAAYWFDQVRVMTRRAAGIEIAAGKQYLFDARLAPIARALGFHSSEALVRGAVKGDAALCKRIAEAMATHETLFFRDPAVFNLAMQAIQPALSAARRAGRKPRIWSAGCSTGQEAYSVAMALRGPGGLAKAGDAEISGTDFSGEVIARAAAARYSQFEIQRGLPVHYMVGNFRKSGSAWEAVPELRNSARFAVRNLMDDFSDLGKFDVILCRNVLLYFAEDQRRSVVAKLGAALVPGGFLFIGTADLPLGGFGELNPVMGVWGLLRREAI